MPLRYIAHDGGTLPAGLSDSLGSESRNTPVREKIYGPVENLQCTAQHYHTCPSYPEFLSERKKKFQSVGVIKVSTDWVVEWTVHKDVISVLTASVKGYSTDDLSQKR